MSPATSSVPIFPRGSGDVALSTSRCRADCHGGNMHCLSTARTWISRELAVAVLPARRCALCYRQVRQPDRLGRNHVGLKAFNPSRTASGETSCLILANSSASATLTPIFRAMASTRAVSGRSESMRDSHWCGDLIQDAGWMEAGMDGQAVVDGPSVASASCG